jgi:hypothetical protein
MLKWSNIELQSKWFIERPVTKGREDEKTKFLIYPFFPIRQLVDSNKQ